jgi:type I restriction enzyme S subunit
MLPGDIVYGRRGDIGRRAFISRKYAGWFCGTGCLRIRPNPGVISPFYLFNHLGQDEVLGNIRGRAQGVTLPNLSAGVMESVPITIPPRQIQESFESAAIPMQELAENLHDQIHVLRRTRDLILPRLMSGTLAVEALATAEAMP